jgi:lipase chaperone LimK
LSFGRVWFWVAASTAAVAVVLAVLAARDRPSPTAKVVSVVAPSPAPTEPDSASRETAAAPPAPRPESLAGTEPDGALVVDAAGVFVATPDAIDFFDYYLSAFGEEPLEETRFVTWRSWQTSPDQAR